MSDIDLDALAAQHRTEHVRDHVKFEPDPPARRLEVKRTPHDDTKPWRAVVKAPGTSFGDTPVGAFTSHAEAIRAGCTALRFIASGIPWRVQS